MSQSSTFFIVGFFSAMLIYAAFQAVNEGWLCRFLKRLIDHVVARINPDRFLQRVFAEIDHFDVVYYLGTKDFEGLSRIFASKIIDLDAPIGLRFEPFNTFCKRVHVLFDSFPDDGRVGERDPSEVSAQFVRDCRDFLRFFMIKETVEVLGNCPEYLIRRLDPVLEGLVREALAAIPVVSQRVRDFIHDQYGYRKQHSDEFGDSHVSMISPYVAAFNVKGGRS